MTPTPELNAALTQVVQALAGLLVILIGLLTSYISLRVTQWVDAKKQDTQWGTLVVLATTAVQSVEQSAAKGMISNEAEAMKDEAVKQLQALADTHGVKVDLATMSSIIESLLLQGIHKGLDKTTTVSATATTTSSTPEPTPDVKIEVNPKG